ncbi:MAG: Fe-S cluster assembly protein SufD [Nocardioides sp.]
MTLTDSPAQPPLAEISAGAVQGAVESHQVASHLNPPGSFDLADHPVPNGREEIWRFTPLKRLRGLHDGSFTPGGTHGGELSVPEPVRVDSVGRDDPRLGTVYTPGDRVSAQAWASFDTAMVVTVPAEAEVAEPVVLTVDGDDAGAASFGHLFIDVERHARATVVLDHRGSVTRAVNVEVRLGAQAAFTLVSLQDFADDAVYLAHQHARIGSDASYKHVAVTFGGDLVRVNTSVEYAGPGAAAELLGLYFADEGQHFEHRLFVDHTAPRTRSNVVYKGALQGQGAHTVWIGNVLIRKVAEGIDTYEENRNLVLTDGCQADSVPNLEIETGEIEGAGHASATGRFDDNQLFYLRSRGIDESEARRLVVHGFFNDLIRRIDVPELEDKLRSTVEAELAKTVLAGPA